MISSLHFLSRCLVRKEACFCFTLPPCEHFMPCEISVHRIFDACVCCLKRLRKSVLNFPVSFHTTHVVVWPLNLRKCLIYAESVLVYKNPLAITIKDWREDLWRVGGINEFHVSVYRRKTYDSVPRDENWGGVYNWSVANDAKTWQLLNWKSNTVVVGRLWAFLDIPFLPAPRLLR